MPPASLNFGLKAMDQIECDLMSLSRQWSRKGAVLPA